MQARSATGTIVVLTALLLTGCASMPDMQADCRQPNYPLAVAGTVIGGLLGGQVGAGTGRHIAIAAGAGLGAVAGSRMNCR
jgi:outer membrane lipoprotein SlyB